MKIVFFGTPNFSIPALQAIIDSKYTLLSVVTNPDKKSGRGLTKSSSAIKTFCKQENIPCVSFDNFNDNQASDYLKELNLDLIVVVAFKILPEKIINIPKYGAINLHPSLLPKYRGSSPIQQTILNGDSKTGVTIFKLDKKVDSGDIIIQEEYNVKDNVIFSELYSELSDFGAKVLLKGIDLLDEKNIVFIKQEEGDISYAFKIQGKDCQINWSDSAESINNKIRAFTYTPGAFTFLDDKKIKFFNSNIIKAYDEKLKPGECSFINETLLIGTNTDLVSIKNVQVEGKKIISAKDFSNSMFFHNNKIINFE